MNWEEIIVTIIFTTIAGATVAFVSIYLKEKINRKKLLKALCCEIKLNLNTAESNIENWEPGFKLSELYKFHVSVFKTVLLSGVLSDISSKILYAIDEAYSDMDKFNNNELYDTPNFVCENIKGNLSYLMEMFCKKI